MNEILKSSAHVVLCPSTEGNLGDGIFPFRSYIAEGGKWSIGSDSHVGLCPMEELRWLDYGQRLISHSRNTAGSIWKGKTGEYLYLNSLQGGLKAAGINAEPGFKEGDFLSGLVIDPEHPLIASTTPEWLLNTLVYSGNSQMIREVWVKGKKMVSEGKHLLSESLREKFQKLLKKAGHRL